jgi:hypothetical protein
MLRLRSPERLALHRITVHTLVLWAALAAACSSKPPDEPKDYAAKIAEDRAAKDAQFAAGADPVPTARHKDLLPLVYFPIDPEYNVPGVLKPVEDKTVFEMPTSIGTMRQMRRVGSLEFTLKGTQLKLIVFVEVSLHCLQRPDERHRDLSGRPLSGPAAQRHEHLRGGLQPRLQPVLLLQPGVRVSLPATRESPDDPDSRRREDKVGSEKRKMKSAISALIFDLQLSTL